MGRDTVLVSLPEPALPRLSRVWALQLTGGDVSNACRARREAVGVSSAEVVSEARSTWAGGESGHHTRKQVARCLLAGLRAQYRSRPGCEGVFTLHPWAREKTVRQGRSLVYGGGALLTQEISRVPQIMSAMQLNLSPLKEPLGFIKVLEWISSICSFATCGGYHGTTQMIVSCVNSTAYPANKTTEASFAYPFRLPSATFEEIDDKLCEGKWEELHLTGDYSSPAQFYVTVAVFAFLYCIGALVLYLGFKQLYQTNSKLPLIDFILTVIFTFLWLVSSSAWAKGLTDVKTATDPVNSAVNCLIPFKCVGGIGPHLKSLNISVLFGFLNWVLWTGNAWFVYKETTLHRTPAPSTEHGTDHIPPALSK